MSYKRVSYWFRKWVQEKSYAKFTVAGVHGEVIIALPDHEPVEINNNIKLVGLKYNKYSSVIKHIIYLSQILIYFTTSRKSWPG